MRRGPVGEPSHGPGACWRTKSWAGGMLANQVTGRGHVGEPVLGQGLLTNQSWAGGLLANQSRPGACWRTTHGARACWRTSLGVGACWRTKSRFNTWPSKQKVSFFPLAQRFHLKTKSITLLVSQYFHLKTKSTGFLRWYFHLKTNYQFTSIPTKPLCVRALFHRKPEHIASKSPGHQLRQD